MQKNTQSRNITISDPDHFIRNKLEQLLDKHGDRLVSGQRHKSYLLRLAVSMMDDGTILDKAIKKGA